MRERVAITGVREYFYRICMDYYRVEYCHRGELGHMKYDIFPFPAEYLIWDSSQKTGIDHKTKQIRVFCLEINFLRKIYQNVGERQKPQQWERFRLVSLAKLSSVPTIQSNSC